MPLSDFGYGKKKAKLDQEKFNFMPVGGTFECQAYGCELVKYEAKLYQNERLLVWVCDEGHRSYIEEFG